MRDCDPPCEGSGPIPASGPEGEIGPEAGAGRAPPWTARPPLWPPASPPPLAAVCAGILLVNGAVALWLALLGRDLLPPSAPLQWWSASLRPRDNSQHLMDPYSLLHAIAGAALCLAAGRRLPSWPVRMRLLIVVASSGVWEAVENTPRIIALFNDPAPAGLYRGDSIVNALSDTAFVAAGYLGGHSLPRWLVVAAGVLAEVCVAVMIHDGFVLGTARLVLR